MYCLNYCYGGEGGCSYEEKINRKDIAIAKAKELIRDGAWVNLFNIKTDEWFYFRSKKEVNNG